MSVLQVLVLIVGVGAGAFATILVWGTYRAIRAERQRWASLRQWIEYRSQGDRALFPADPNLEQRINRLAQSHTEPLRRRLETVEAALRRERKIPEPERTEHGLR